jgi:DNA-binding response OmpR family regulator
MNILLVEPDKLLATTYAKALQDDGHRLIWSQNAQQAIFAADTLVPDLVILELQLVSHSGIEFLYEFRSYPDWQHIPVLVLSQVPPTEFIDSWELLQDQLGVVDYLYKPHTTLAKLRSTLQSEFTHTDFPAKAGIQ